MTFYGVEIWNVAKAPEMLMVYDNDRKRPALFKHQADAIEACRIVEQFRIDNAFLQAIPKEIEWDLA